MRVIEFRGKCIDDGEWAYGDYFSSNEMPKRGEVGHFIKCGLSEEYRVIPETVGQYTGLKDKNGKEIYEGDVVQNIVTRRDFTMPKDTTPYSYTDVEYATQQTVEYDEHWAEFKVISTIERGILEVIGNIYENPELLKGGQ